MDGVVEVGGGEGDKRAKQANGGPGEAMENHIYDVKLYGVRV